MTMDLDSFELMRARLSLRAQAYRACFQASRSTGARRPWWAFWRPGPHRVHEAGATVLRDLARFCYVHKSTLKISRADQHADAISMAHAEGRREVYLWITAQLNADAAEIDRITRMRESDG